MTFIASIAHAQDLQARNAENGPYDTFVYVGVIVSTISLFAGFIVYATGSGMEDYAKHHVVVITEDGKLLRLYFRSIEVKNSIIPPIGLVGKTARAIDMANKAQEVKIKEDFFEKDQFPEYIEGILSGAIPYVGRVNFDYVENPKITKENKNGMTIFYTEGDYKRVDSFNITRAYEGYDELRNFLLNCSCSIDYADKKKGEYLVAARE